LEPNELANAPADKLLAVLPELSLDSSRQLQLLEKKAPYDARSGSKRNHQSDVKSRNNALLTKKKKSKRLLEE